MQMIDNSRYFEIIEAVLYASGHPVSYDKIADILEVSPSDAKKLVEAYGEIYNTNTVPRGVQLIMFDNACQLCTKSDYESHVKIALGVKQGRGSLSNSSLEVLAIIAYHQPVTRAYIDQVRGLDSSYSIAVLLEKNLIEKKGRLDVPGRPSLYGTTLDFLRCFGLTSLDQLPAVEMLTMTVNEEEGINSTEEGQTAPEEQAHEAENTNENEMPNENDN